MHARCRDTKLASLCSSVSRRVSWNTKHISSNFLLHGAAAIKATLLKLVLIFISFICFCTQMWIDRGKLILRFSLICSTMFSSVTLSSSLSSKPHNPIAGPEEELRSSTLIFQTAKSIINELLIVFLTLHTHRMSSLDKNVGYLRDVTLDTLLQHNILSNNNTLLAWCYSTTCS